ncbi:hypothetical protein IMZ31_16710 [Pontibacillus sp. ALD_SL1]|uniref:hypothetical protein n=1 Tax=Pontibacillus sp. ALD_SL1 TaxID=2777185 RepID=UPI001A977535|nr:hypothetical protein [Pontibacillus sp. ALD_SL1]QSS99686.1 hypothetical protein IMZ31_16710 [Pontibacillus sp. ALD_SL1]
MEMLSAVLLVLCVGLAIYIYKYEEPDELSVVFQTKESGVGLAQELYWLLETNQVKPHYSIPYNKRNLFEFGYHECEVIIEVPKEHYHFAVQLVERYKRDPGTRYPSPCREL